MAAIGNMMQATNTREALAPWWHTVLVMATIGGLSEVSARQNGLVNLHVPGLTDRLSSYITVLMIEWFLVLVIWLPLRQRGRTMASVVAGRWPTLGAFFRDLGLALGFFAIIAVPISLLADRFAGHAQSAAAISMLPKTWFEVVMWVALSASAGFCEEFVFRGYFTQQFSAWTGSRVVGIAGQAVLFGLGHGYYNAGTMISVIGLGLALGLLAHWRKSLRPGILGHGLTDAIGGVAAFFGVR